MTKIKRLGDAELEIMLVIWEAQRAVSSSYVLSKLEGKRDWKLSTLMTVLSRLVDKGFLELHKEGRNNSYTPTITEEAYRRSESKDVLEKLFGNNIRAMVSSLIGGKAVSEEDIHSLRQYLDDIERKT